MVRIRSVFVHKSVLASVTSEPFYVIELMLEAKQFIGRLSYRNRNWLQVTFNDYFQNCHFFTLTIIVSVIFVLYLEQTCIIPAIQTYHFNSIEHFGILVKQKYTGVVDFIQRSKYRYVLSKGCKHKQFFA